MAKIVDPEAKYIACKRNQEAPCVHQCVHCNLAIWQTCVEADNFHKRSPIFAPKCEGTSNGHHCFAHERGCIVPCTHHQGLPVEDWLVTKQIEAEQRLRERNIRLNLEEIEVESHALLS